MVIFTETYFNSRPHGGRQHFVLTPVSPLIFQLTPSRRATATYIVILYLAYFNSRPHGGRRCLRVVLRLLAYFNSRPHGGRPSRDSSFSALLKFQLTPSRRATERRRDDKRREGISTHALTEGDRKRCAAESHTGISTHALTEGDTFALLFFVFSLYFNSRPHGGRR